MGTSGNSGRSSTARRTATSSRRALDRDRRLYWMEQNPVGPPVPQVGYAGPGLLLLVLLPAVRRVDGSALAAGPGRPVRLERARAPRAHVPGGALREPVPRLRPRRRPPEIPEGPLLACVVLLVVRMSRHARRLG